MLQKFFRFIHKEIKYTQAKYRKIYYKYIFGEFGNNSRILGKIKTYQPQNIFLGSNSSINHGVILNARAKIIIGNYVHISSAVIINTVSLNLEKTKDKRNHLKKEVIIHNGVWLASGSIINPGVIIGENSIVAAGAVVTKNIPANVVVAGVPARVIKQL